MSLKNVFTRITCDKKQSEANADELMKQCQERLKTDPNYGMNNYEMDFIRYKVLKLLPENRDTKPNDTSLMTDDEDDQLFMNGSAFANTNDDSINFTTPTRDFSSSSRFFNN